MRNILLTISLLMAATVSADRVGRWETHLAYGDITDIEPAGKIVYVLSSKDLFFYNVSDGSITTLDKTNVLNDCGVTHIAWNSAVKRLVAVYENYNIDLIDNGGNTTNVSDYYNKTMTEDKRVNNVICNGRNAYVCTAFGILKIEVDKATISDTYNLGRNVTRCAVTQDAIYADTYDGIFKCLTTDNMLDPNNWKPTADAVSFANRNEININYDNGYAERFVYDEANKCYWSNNADNKLQAWTDNGDGTRTVTHDNICPDAPKYNCFGFMMMHRGKLYTCNGKGWDFGEPASIQIYDTDEKTWTTFDNKGVADRIGAVYQDVMAVAPDPRDPQRLMAGTQSGLLEFYDGKLRNYWNPKNSPIDYNYNVSANDENRKNYSVVSSLLFDNDGNLWVANTASLGSVLLRLNADGTWTTPPNDLKAEECNFLKIKCFNDKGMLWMNDNSWTIPMLVLYDPATGAKNQYSNFTNEDGQTYINVSGCTDIAIDREGNVWTGVNHGLFALTPEYINDPQKGFYQVKVPRNDGTNLADYLLSGVSVTAIAIDNADRKWVGTNGNGLYVISQDCMVEEAHFTAANSSLISDNILSLLIDDNGKVYIGTDKGLCSYQSEAGQTNEDMNKDNVWAYPNPVRPDYRGPITITGLAFNADVKITTSAGTLVAQGRSTGGTYIWDGNDMKGRRVASGIYMVNTATESGGKGTVCKIAVIN